MLNSKILNKIKSPFIIYADFESILLIILTNIKNMLLVVMVILSEDAVYSFFSSMIEEGKYCSDLIKKYCNKELVLTKEDDKVF